MNSVPQQCFETSLFEVLIRSQSFCNAALAHSDKCEAVRQTPFFVETLTIKLKGCCGEVFRNRNYLDRRRRFQCLQESYRGSSKSNFRESVANFQTHCPGRENRDMTGLYLARQCDCLV